MLIFFFCGEGCLTQSDNRMSPSIVIPQLRENQRTPHHQVSGEAAETLAAQKRARSEFPFIRKEV